MQLQREVRFGSATDVEVPMVVPEDRLPCTAEMPAAIRRELIEKLRKADRPVLASMPPL